MKRFMMLVFGVLFGVGRTVGAPVAVVNPGFEDISGETVVNEFTFGELNGWTLYEDGVDTSNGDGPTFFVGTLMPFEADPVGMPGVFTNFPGGAAEGQRVMIAFNFAGSGDVGEYGLEQTLGAVLEAGMTYTLEVEVGNIASGTAMSGQFFDLDGFPGYRVELLAGGEVLECDDNSLFGLIPEGEWATSTVTFTPAAGDTRIGDQLGIRVVNLNEVDPVDPGADLEVDFDDVRLDASAAVCEGDANGDSVVDVNDISYVLFRLGGPPPDGDANGDGMIDVNDISYVLFRLGDSCG